MPFLAIPVVIMGVTMTVGAILTVVSIALTIGMTVYGAVSQKAAAKKAARRAAAAAAAAREQWLASLQDRTVTRIATEAPQMYIYGRARVGSSVVAIFSSGSNEQYIHIVSVHAAHQSDAIEEVYLNGRALGTLDADGFVTGGDYYDSTTNSKTETFTTNPFTLMYLPVGDVVVTANNVKVLFGISGTTVSPIEGVQPFVATYTYKVPASQSKAQVRVKKHLGIPGDIADASLRTEVPLKWLNTATLTGLTYTVIRLDLNQKEFQGGLPNIDVLIRGKKLYDPRTTLTVWSQNPALVVYDYLLSEMCGVPIADVPVASYITAANVCDEVIVIDADTNKHRYTCNGTVTSDQDQGQTLEAFAQCMAGAVVGLTWDIYAGKYIAPVMSLNQSDCVGTFTVTAGISDGDLFNGVIGQNISVENDYVATDFPPYTNAAFLAWDNEEKFANITFPYTDKIQRVHNLSRIFVEDHRNAFSIKADFSYKTWDLNVGDRVYFTSAFLGQTDKVYRVTDKTFSPTSAIELSLKEDAAEIYDLADDVDLDSTPNSNLPSPFTLIKLDTLVCTSGTTELLLQQNGTIVSRIRVTWPAVVQLIKEIEIEWRATHDEVWQRLIVNRSETTTFITDVKDLDWYHVRARTVNFFDGHSDWTYAPLHQVIGKSEPPGNVTLLEYDGLELRWPTITEPDLSGYLIRYHIGTNLDWGTAVHLHDGVLTSSPYFPPVPPYGFVTLMIKAIDTSGNESAGTASCNFYSPTPVPSNVFATHDFHPVFAGTQDNCTVVGTYLTADTGDSFYGDEAASFYKLDAESFYGPLISERMIYTTDTVTVAAVLMGSAMLLDLDVYGEDVIVEFQINGGSWIGWPGSVTATASDYKFRVTIGSGHILGEIRAMSMIIDAVDIDETIPNLVIGATATTIPILKTYYEIVAVSATVVGNTTGGIVGLEVDKTNPAAPTILAFDATHTAVTGVTADIIVKGY